MEPRGQAAATSFCSGDSEAGGRMVRNSDPARRWAFPNAVFCPVPVRSVPCALPGHRARGRGLGRSGSKRKVHGPLVCTFVRARCARWERGAEKLPPSGFSPSGLTVPISTFFSDELSTRAALKDCDPFPPPAILVFTVRPRLHNPHPATIRTPLALGPRDCRNPGRRHSGGRASGLCTRKAGVTGVLSARGPVPDSVPPCRFRAEVGVGGLEWIC